ncbi:hypothetical protein GE061_009436 [Apolygus lucorum]|uniref:Uncharacterized protein n=1 Tax=Apolygus lucorum TaxID=248454 RepID=A0A6A4JW00_APOLU|nr:hypothetical protein GE061_009436 [Apolygus lucorum]
MIAGRDSSGSLAGGVGVYQTGQINLGNFGKLSVKGTTTMDGKYTAVVDTEVFNGPRSFNPMTVSLTRQPNGVDFIGTSDLGWLSGTYSTSTQSNVIPKFEVHLNTNGWITAVANGRIKDRQIEMLSYNAGFNTGPLSASVNMDGDRNVTDYEVGASLGLIHGTMKIDRAKSNQRSYKAGVSLGIVSFDTEINADSTRVYNAELDTGILRYSYNIDKDDSTNWKGSVDLANIGIDYERTKEGLTIAGGRIQLGTSVINIHRDSTGHYTVKVNQGSIVE